MKTEKKQKKKRKSPPLYTSILLLLMAIASVTAVTIAWLSIADSTRVRSMSMDVTSGAALRFDLDAHATFEEYVTTLNFAQISARIQADQGFSMQTTPLRPVTSSNFVDYTFENGSVVQAQTGAYLEFELNFIATRDMVVHLSTTQTVSQPATSVTSNNTALPQAMRISFTADGATYIYNPGMGNTSVEYSGAKMFGLPPKSEMVYSFDNAMFSLKEGVNKVVLVHVWLEGTDAACTNDLKGADYSIALRFEGTDEQNRLFEGEG